MRTQGAVAARTDLSRTVGRDSWQSRDCDGRSADQGRTRWAGQDEAGLLLADLRRERGGVLSVLCLTPATTRDRCAGLACATRWRAVVRRILGLRQLRQAHRCDPCAVLGAHPERVP